MFVVLITFLVVAGVGAAIGIPLYLKRRAYIQELEARGWTFVNSPDISVAHGLNLPPFGLGARRKVDDQIVGRSANGTPFQAFQYSTAGWSSGDGYVVCVRLSRPLPALFAMPPFRPRPGVRGQQFSSSPLLVVAEDADFARAVQPQLAGLVASWPAGLVPDVSIDHQDVVAIGVGPTPAEVAAVVEALARFAGSLEDSSLASFTGPPAPPELSHYEHPDWIYRPRDDGALSRVRHSGGGSGHRATEVTIAPSGPLPFVALTHEWETTRTVTTSDGNGGTTTRTEVDHHREQIFEIHPTFPFGEFKVNAGIMGNKRTFEWHDFNERFTVRAPDARFASDVFHPRMMEFLMATNPPPFVHDDGRLVITTAHQLEAWAHAIGFLSQFFARVPGFVWDNLGVHPAPFPEPDPLARGQQLAPR